MAEWKGPLSEQLRLRRISDRHITHTDPDPIVRRLNRYVASHSAIVDDLVPQRVVRRWARTLVVLGGCASAYDLTIEPRAPDTTCDEGEQRSGARRVSRRSTGRTK